MFQTKEWGRAVALLTKKRSESVHRCITLNPLENAAQILKDQASIKWIETLLSEQFQDAILTEDN